MVYLLSFLFAFLLSLFLTPLVKRVASYLNIVDNPSDRKIHKKPIPLLGGVAVFLAFIISTIFFWQQGYLEGNRISSFNILALIIGSFILILGGILDDKFNLKPTHQFFFPILAVLLVIISGVKIQFITNPLGGVLVVPPILGTTAALVWLLGMIYTTKLLDGLDGLVAGVTFIGSIIIYIVSLSWDQPLSGTSIFSLILAGAVLGFLPFNWHPARIFLGEGGSIFCGFVLGWLAIISGSKIATALLIMGIPILDVAWVILRRLWQGKSIASSDLRHLHFRLLDIGLTQRQAVVFIYFITAAFGLTSLFLHTQGKILALFILTIIMLILGSSLVIIYHLKRRDENA